MPPLSDEEDDSESDEVEDQEPDASSDTPLPLAHLCYALCSDKVVRTVQQLSSPYKVLSSQYQESMSAGSGMFEKIRSARQQTKTTPTPIVVLCVTTVILLI